MVEIRITEDLYLDILIPRLLGNLTPGPPLLYIDNQAALALVKNPTHHNRTKHIDIRYHFIRSEIEAGSINLQSIGTKDNIADIFTKALPKATFEVHQSGIGISIFP